MTRTRVLALDLALRKSGVCSPDGETSVLRSSKDSSGMQRLCEIVSGLRSLLDEHRPDVVTIEGYSYGSSSNNLVQFGELGGLVRMLVLCTYELPMLVVPPGSLKRYATGSGNADKTQVVVAARERLGFARTDADEADALWLWAFGVEHSDGEAVVRLPKTHRVAVLGAQRLAPLDEQSDLLERPREAST